MKLVPVGVTTLLEAAGNIIDKQTNPIEQVLWALWKTATIINEISRRNKHLIELPSDRMYEETEQIQLWPHKFSCHLFVVPAHHEIAVSTTATKNLVDPENSDLEQF